MKIASVVDRDFKIYQSNVNALFAWYKNQIADCVRDFQNNVMKLSAFHLSNMSSINFSNFKITRLDKIIGHEVEQQANVLQARILPIWHKMRRQTNLSGRLFMGFVARKNQPPWKQVKLDIGTPIPEKNGSDRWSKDLPYRMQHLQNEVMKAITMGVHNEESVHQIMNRVKALFHIPKRRAREDYRPQIYKQAARMNDQYDQESWTVASQLTGEPPVDVTQGFYTIQDVEALNDAQKEAMGWYYREYNPQMDEAIWSRNLALMSIEQDVMRDAIHRLHEGELTVGSENMGVEDFVWVTRKPQKECDACCMRDGMTMSEIKEKFGTGRFAKDEHVYPPELRQDSPPALHPHCACRLVAKLKDDWGDQNYKDYQWNDVSGQFFNPSAQEKQYGFTKMSYDQWISNIGEPDAKVRQAQ